MTSPALHIVGSARHVRPRCPPPPAFPTLLRALFPLLLTAACAAGELPRVATFRCDVTPPKGQPLFFGDPLQTVAAPLLAKGIVVESAGTRHVLCALDWCAVSNGTHLSMRRRIAEAVDADPDDVAVQTLHQHTAPLVDIDAQRILAEHGDATAHVDPEWLAATEGRIADAAREARANLRAFDRVGTGKARVDRVASNRRVRDAQGAVAGRTSLAPAALRELPEGRIDPFVRTITLAAGDEPLVRLHFYATHPQVNYGDGVATSDFVGMAREDLEAREGVFQVYFTGASGDVTVGKYNVGSDACRRAFADRLLAGMTAAVAATSFEAVGDVEWRIHRFSPPRRTDDDFSAAACVGRMRDPRSSPVDRLYRSALRLASVRRERDPIILTCLQLGAVRIVTLPGEPLLDFQLFAQRLLPDEFVAVAAHGDNATGYICTAAEFAAGGYEASVSICTPEVEGLLKKGIAALLQPADAVVEPLPRIPPREPAAALDSFALAPGYRIEQVAAEPLVHSPVAIDFDERGRCFVVEMIDYSEQEHDSLGAIRLLEDLDGDGRFDTGTVFAAGLSWPTGLLCADGGVFVCAAPDILHFKDVDGDGVADVRRVVFTGFGRGNVQGLLNSLRWGLDCRIHGATSSAGAPRIVRPDDPSCVPVDLDGRDFSFDPRRLDLRPETGCLQHGMTFDDWGRKFVSGNSDPVEMVFFEDRYAARNPFHAMPPSRGSIAVDGGTAEVFRASPVEPWRVLRTRMRNADPELGPVEAGGRATGYFTGASGITACRGDAFPAEMRGCVVVGDVGSNLVHRERLTPAGPFLEARRIDRESEFVRSDDVWFRPAQFANGPDGTLYVIDVYREVIEHPRSLPPEIKQQVDLTSGSDRGRLYRIVPDGCVPRPRNDLSSASTAHLAEALAHRNGWHRDTAARLLFERQDPDAAGPLERLARESSLPEGRMHALYALAGLGRLTATTVLGGLADGHPRVREHAVRLAERFADEPRIRAALCGLTDDDARVRYQLAFSLGEFAAGPDRTRALADLAVRDGEHAYPRAALCSSLATGAVDVLADLAARPGYAAAAGGALLEEVAAQVGRRLDPAEVAALESVLEAAPDAATPLWAGFLAGRLQATAERRAALPASPAVAAARQLLLDRCRTTALDESAVVADRVAAIRRLAIGTFADSATTFDALLQSRQPQAVQRAGIDALEAIGAPEAGAWLLARWPALSPGLRAAAATAVFGRAAWVRAFFQAVEGGHVALSDFDPAQVRLLANRREPEIRAGYGKLAERLRTSPRQEVLAAYRPALALGGDPARGAAHFAKACAQCHRVAGVGHEVGPNLAAFAHRGPEAILLNLLDPNREVNPLYVAYVAQLADGRVLTGMIADETAAGITLKRAEAAVDTIRRSDIEHLESTGQSIMPEGLEKQFDVQAVADLIAYLTAPR